MQLRPARFPLAVAALFLLGALAGPVGVASATPPIWEPSFGPEIPGLAADDVSEEVEIPTFTMPFYGVTRGGAEKFSISSNGYVQFGGGKATSNSPSGEAARTELPKVGPLWTDLNPTKFPPQKPGGA